MRQVRRSASTVSASVSDNLLLLCQGVADGVNRAGELHKQTISHGLEQAPVIAFEQRIDYRAALLGQSSQRLLLGSRNEPTETDQIGR